MKIAFICSDRGPCPPVKGGAIQLLISKVAPFLAANHQVTVFSISDPNLSNHETVQGVTYIRYEQQNYLDQVRKHLEEEPVDIIQLYNRPAWILPLRSVLPKARIILSLHNRLDQVKLSKKMLRANMKEANKILTVSKFIKRDTIKRVPVVKKKIEVLYTGASLDEYAPVWSSKGKRWRSEIRQKHGIGEKETVILFVSRLVSYKGCHLVLEALRKALGKNRKVTLLIVGSIWYADNRKNEYTTKLEELAKKSENKVIFTSYVPVEQIPKYYTAADLFVCASQWKEPLARVHYEAMAAGVPIVTTKRGGNPEVVKQGKTGLVIKEHKSPKQYREAFKRLLSNPEKARKMGKKGRRLVEKKYNFKRVAHDLEAIYSTQVKKLKTL